MNVLNKVKEPESAKSEAFIEAYDQCVNSIYRFILFKVSSKETAWDLVQECFLKTWKHAQENRAPIKNYRAILYSVAKNLVIDYWRKKDKNSTIDLEEIAFMLHDNDDLFEKMVIKEEAEKILQILNKVPERQKEILILRYIEGLAFSEIAKIMGKSVVAVRVEAHRAMKKLKQMVNGQNND